MPTEEYRGLSWSALLTRLQVKPVDEWAWVEACRRLHACARFVALAHPSMGMQVAEDLAQRVLLKLQSADTLENVSSSHSPAAYLETMLRNVKIDLLRQERVEHRAIRRLAGQRRREARVLPDPPQSFPVELQRLSEEERNLLRMRFWEDRSIGEIAKLLQVKYSTAAVRLFRLLNKLRTDLSR